MVLVQVLLLSVLCFCPGLVFARRMSMTKSDSLEAGLLNQSTKGTFDACYCKKVKSSSECPWSSKPEDVSKFEDMIQQTRFFHSDGNLCCKWVDDRRTLWTGMGFHKKPLDLCTTEQVVDVPTTSCCVLRDAFGTVGVRVRKVAREFVTEAQRYTSGEDVLNMVTTAWIPDVSDIIGSADLSGAPINQTVAQAFVTEKLKEQRYGELQCESPMEKIVTTEVRDDGCKLISEPPKLCCCNVQRATRCLPNTGSATVPEAQRLLWQATLKDYIAPGTGRVEETKILWENSPDEKFKDEAGIQTAPTETDDGHTYSWQLQPNQWNYDCSKNVTVKTVESYEGWKDVQTYNDGVFTRTKRVWQTLYRQGRTQACGQRTLTRKCGPGQAMYYKIIPPGECLTDKSKMVENPKFVYKCPHVSSLDTRPGYKGLCRCPDTDCKGEPVAWTKKGAEWAQGQKWYSQLQSKLSETISEGTRLSEAVTDFVWGKRKRERPDLYGTPDGKNAWLEDLIGQGGIEGIGQTTM